MNTPYQNTPAPQEGREASEEPPYYVALCANEGMYWQINRRGDFRMVCRTQGRTPAEEQIADTITALLNDSIAAARLAQSQQGEAHD
jgi:hypothetical protein